MIDEGHLYNLVYAKNLEITMQPVQPPLSESRFSLRRDDFSVQLSHTIDKFFWLRIQTLGSLDDDPSVLVISDFKRSNLTDDELVDAIRIGIESANRWDGFDRLVMLDIAPNAVADRERIAQKEAAEITNLLTRAFSANNRIIKSSKIKRVKEKINIEFSINV